MASYSPLTVIAIALLIGICALVKVRRMVFRMHEMGRFKPGGSGSLGLISRWINRLANRQSASTLRNEGRLLISIDELRKLRDLGVSADQALVRYVILREIWIGITLVVCAYALVSHPPVFAAIFTVAAIVLAVWIPRGLLDLRWEARQRLLRLEIPIVFGLLNAAIQTGAEVVRVFDTYADIFKGKHGRAPFAESLSRAKWCARIAGSWSQGLLQVQEGAGGEVVAESVGKLVTVMRSDTADYKEQLGRALQGAERSLERELRNHQRLVFAKTATLIATSVFGGLIMSGFSLMFC
jgi:hypothetical protein